jgi:hypothetical protein
MTTYYRCFFCVRKEEDDDNALSFSMVLLEQKKQ